MATTHVSPDMPKPSFAKVAATVTKEAAPTAATAKIDSNVPATAVIADGSSSPESKRAAAPKSNGVAVIVSSLNGLNIASKVPSLVVDGRGSVSEPEPRRSNPGKESGSDDSPKCDSSSDLGTKPPSLDGKSITSGTTFALDEKESLRPDDSASVQAAAEDDDTFSLRGSLVAGSRMSSDVALRNKGILSGDLAERKAAHVAMCVPPHGILTPQSASSERGPPLAAAVPLSTDGSPDALNVIYRQAPDEKLLDALASPRDRYFLLRLEKDVIDFVQDSKEPYMDLPPSNSFCRMLTHKLADYYHMTHSYEPHIGSVRIFRTPFCRVPPSLATMAPQSNPSSSSTPPPAVLPRKIMRRGQDGEGLMSANASKPTSESGSEIKDAKLAANPKLSREQREEVYKAARQRIFGSSEDSIPENDGATGMSRTSSISASNKTGSTKRGKSGKQRRDDSDSFDSRNQYTPYWGPQQQTWVPQSQGQYVPSASGQFVPQPQASYPAQVPLAYNQQTATYANMPVMAPNPAYSGYSMPQQFPPQPPQQRFPSSGSPMTTYGAPVAPGAAPQQVWAQPGYNQPSYPTRVPAQTSGPTQVGIPYAYGQLPVNANPNDPKSQHPIPGSYNRNHAFNPKTQSFVPGGNGMPIVPPPQPPFTAPGSHHGSPQIGTPPHLAYGAYPPSVPQAYAGGYVMARQGSSSSMPGYHTVPHVPSPHMQQPQLPPMPAVPLGPPQQHIPQGSPAHIPGRPPMPVPQGAGQIFTHLPTYGNPATLPQKPATGI
ncbi:hypothetical protein H634G_00160 [Metarhizium anisopliae BRIP 53293]|uniref:R3H domain-containing protein n=1 Tax=Metarhizium anisopliae BRIP 53293 TaxID=1291518 RepID=A0A0D9PEG9_METAN|nr:hypothetical protein H634G_00160 [Metarhizium anisopliae BRIP 53293]KJK90357.1 hypothetical protein H633G_05766 [Metarhizium anisopliae BRIP 53284]